MLPALFCFIGQICDYVVKLTIKYSAKGIQRVNDFSREALTDDPNEGIRDYDMSAVNMEREFGEIEK